METEQEGMEKSYQSFWAESKTFEISFSRGGRWILFTELSRYFSFNLELERELTPWLLENVRAAMSALRDGTFKRINRKYQSLIVLETFTNSRGSVLKISKFFNGRCFSIILPEGRRGEAWVSLCNCLSYFNGENPQKRAQHTRKEEHTTHYPIHVENENPWGRNLKTVPAILVFRSDSYTSWKMIETMLGTRLRQKVLANPISDDRALVWCRDAEEMQWLSKEEVIYMSNGQPITVLKWSHSAQ